MADIGATLREARMRARIDINEVEASTKIRAKYLRAIENEEWGLLPGDVYVKSFLRTYGDYLGVDSRQLIDDYKRRYERPADHEMRPLAPLGRERERRGGRGGGGPGRGGGPPLPPWALIGAVVVAIAVVLYLVGSNKGSGGSQTAQSSSSRQVAGGHRARPHHHRAHSRSRAHGSTAGTGAAATTVKLQLVPTGTVWVCLVDGSGKPLIPGLIYAAGDTIPTKTSSKLLLTLGSAAVKMKVNGQSITVPSTGRPVGYELTPGSQTPLPAGKQPQCT